MIQTSGLLAMIGLPRATNTTTSHWLMIFFGVYQSIYRIWAGVVSDTNWITLVNHYEQLLTTIRYDSIISSGQPLMIRSFIVSNEVDYHYQLDFSNKKVTDHQLSQSFIILCLRGFPATVPLWCAGCRAKRALPLCWVPAAKAAAIEDLDLALKLEPQEMTWAPTWDDAMSNGLRAMGISWPVGHSIFLWRIRNIHQLESQEYDQLIFLILHRSMVLDHMLQLDHSHSQLLWSWENLL